MYTTVKTANHGKLLNNKYYVAVDTAATKLYKTSTMELARTRGTNKFNHRDTQRKTTFSRRKKIAWFFIIIKLSSILL